MFKFIPEHPPQWVIVGSLVVLLGAVMFASSADSSSKTSYSQSGQEALAREVQKPAKFLRFVVTTGLGIAATQSRGQSIR